MGAGTGRVAGFALAAGLAAMAAAALAQPMSIPARRAGQWRMTMTGAGMPSGVTLTECVDAATERSFSPFRSGGPPGARGPSEADTCSKRDVHKIANGWAFESVCAGRGGAPTTSSGTVTGDFRTHIHLVVDTKGANGARHMEMDQAWVGACPAGGGGHTVTLPDGRTITIPGQ